MNIIRPLLRLLTTLPLGAFAVLALLSLGLPRAHALTTASLTPANLSGKTLTFTIVQGTAPFETSGTFDVIFASATSYTMPVASGNAALRSGTYTVSSAGGITDIVFNGYLVNNATVSASIITTTNDLRSSFEMYSAGNSNKNGTVVFSTGGTGGVTGAPAVTSASTATATIGSAFSYQIAATPAATSFTNSGGNAPVSIPPSTGLVTGTFTAGRHLYVFLHRHQRRRLQPRHHRHRDRHRRHQSARHR